MGHVPAAYLQAHWCSHRGQSGTQQASFSRPEHQGNLLFSPLLFLMLLSMHGNATKVQWNFLMQRTTGEGWHSNIDYFQPQDVVQAVRQGYQRMSV
jgi:hypothetical protein